VAKIPLQEKAPLTDSRVLIHQNKPDGFMCVSCSWAKPALAHPFEFCESGAKATAWDIPLLPLWHYGKESKVPGAKSIPVRVVRTAAAHAG
jgi:hypothetical protein